MTKPNQPRPTAPAKAIRAFCLSCCMESVTEVKLCPADECPLWPFRFGKNPFRKHQTVTESQLQALENARASFKQKNSLQNTENSEAEDFQSVNLHLKDEFEKSLENNREFPTFTLPEEEGR